MISHFKTSRKASETRDAGRAHRCKILDIAKKILRNPVDIIENSRTEGGLETQNPIGNMNSNGDAENTGSRQSGTGIKKQDKMACALFVSSLKYLRERREVRFAALQSIIATKMEPQEVFSVRRAIKQLEKSKALPVGLSALSNI